VSATPPPPNRPVIPLAREWLSRLSTQLAEAFQARERSSADFYSPEILEWKYFPPNDTHAPRAIMLADGEKILAHIGILFSEIHSTAPNFQPVPVVHTIDWFSSPNAGPAATMLYVSAIRRAPVQYALGCSELARKVLLGFKFKEVMQAPLFHSVLNPIKGAIWRDLHGAQPLHRGLVLRALDLAQNLKRRDVRGPLSIRRVERFGNEIQEVIRRRKDHFLYTSRDPGLLNHFLAYPHKNFSAWHFNDGQALRGFAITSCVARAASRFAKVVECFLDEENPQLMAQALSLLRRELREQKADIVSCYATRPSTEAALRTAGFFRRGRTPLYLRDPEKKLPEGMPLHITHIEGDASYL
jgi:hypothetical protein